MRRACGERRLHVAIRVLRRLLRQRVHQIEVEVLEVRVRDLHRAVRLAFVVDAAERGKMLRVEALDPDRETVHARRPEVAELVGLERAGVRLERDLGVGLERQARADRGEQAVDRACGEQARRAAAEEDRMHAPPPHARERRLEVGDQSVDVVVLGERVARLMRIEVAVRALADAPGQVNVEGERRQRREGEPVAGSGGRDDGAGHDVGTRLDDRAEAAPTARRGTPGEYSRRGARRQRRARRAVRVGDPASPRGRAPGPLRRESGSVSPARAARRAAAEAPSPGG